VKDLEDAISTTKADSPLNLSIAALRNYSLGLNLLGFICDAIENVNIVLE
jgi:hypothetical protein